MTVLLTSCCGIHSSTSDSLPRRKALALFAATACGVSWSKSSPVQPVRIALIEGLSGSFANAGEAVFRNLLWATERINQRGGVKVLKSVRPLEIVRFDSGGSVENALSLLRSAIDQGISIIAQGNGSATASALVDALNKHNEREPNRRALLLNYSALDPSLTNERCSPWHFRFDAHTDMRLAALINVLQADASLKKVYLIGQDYSFGQHLLQQARAMLRDQRPDIEIVGDELHSLGRIKDFLPYAAKIQSSGAQAVITGNWGNDLTLLVKSARGVGMKAKFYTFYGNALGAPAAIGEAGVGAVYAVTEWHPNVDGAASAAFYAEFRKRFPASQDDYVHFRMHIMIEMLAAAISKAGSDEALAIARALEGARYDGSVQTAWMRAADHQLHQPLIVSVMDRVGVPGVKHDAEGSGFGFRTVRRFESIQLPTSCRMTRPDT
jgi:branched-chain amino acid transport system substrate-binding protein